MKLAGTCIALAALGAAIFPAAASEELTKKHACLACHTVDNKMVGTSNKYVEAKYRADKEAPKKHAAKVKKGSQRVSGNVPMPPNTAVPDADVNALVKWILSQK